MFPAGGLQPAAYAWRLQRPTDETDALAARRGVEYQEVRVACSPKWPMTRGLPKLLALWALLCAVPARATRSHKHHGVENETKADKDLRQIMLGDNVDKVRERLSIAPPSKAGDDALPDQATAAFEQWPDASVYNLDINGQ